MQKNRTKIGFERVLRSIWEGVGNALGPLSGALGRLLAVLGAFKTEFFSSIGPRWSPSGLLARYLIHLGRIWGEFWEGLGRLLGHLLPIWGGLELN